MNDDLDKYYELLGVAPGTPARELKEAYRDLAKVWHPDRFSHDPRLQQKAQEKLKEINEAYERLTTGRTGGRPRAPEPGGTRAPSPDGRRRGPRAVLLTAAVFCAAFVAALVTLVPRGARGSGEQTPTADVSEAQTSDKAQQPESATRAAAAQPARGRQRVDVRPAAGAASGGESDAAPSARQLPAMPTVTVTIDATTGLLATPDCPRVSTLTYPAGDEPRRHCAVRHKTKEPDSRLKTVGKTLAKPFKRLGGGDATEEQKP